MIARLLLLLPVLLAFSFAQTEQPLAALLRGDSLLLMSNKGRVYCTLRAQMPTNYHQGRIQLQLWEAKDSAYHWVWLDTACQVVARQPGQYLSFRFHEGMARYYDPLSNMWGYLGQGGKMMIAPIFPAAWPFSEGLARVSLMELQGGEHIDMVPYISTKGKVVLRLPYPEAGDFHDGLAWVRTRGGRYGYVNKKGELVIDTACTAATDFQGGVAAVARDGKCGLIDQVGRWVLQPRCDALGVPRGGLVRYRQGGRWGYMALNGTVVISPVYDDARSFSDGRAAVLVGEDWGYIDASGRMAIEPNYAYTPEPFHAGVAWNGRGGYMDPEGNDAFALPAFDDLVDLILPAAYPDLQPTDPLVEAK